MASALSITGVGRTEARATARLEAANNAYVAGALIPMIPLGIPDDSITAVLMGVFLLHGLRPGPEHFDSLT